MNSRNPSERDEDLRRLLQSWKAEAYLPPRFQEQVWRRIDGQGPGFRETWFANFWRALEAAFRRPVLAVSYVIVLLLAGLSIGALQARQETTRLDHALQARYLQVVDPYQNVR